MADPQDSKSLSRIDRAGLERVLARDTQIEPQAMPLLRVATA